MFYEANPSHFPPLIWEGIQTVCTCACIYDIFSQLVHSGHGDLEQLCGSSYHKTGASFHLPLQTPAAFFELTSKPLSISSDTHRLSRWLTQAWNALGPGPAKLSRVEQAFIACLLCECFSVPLSGFFIFYFYNFLSPLISLSNFLSLLQSRFFSSVFFHALYRHAH